MRRITAALGGAMLAGGTILGILAAGPAGATVIPNPDQIGPEFDSSLRVTTHGNGNQLTVEGNGTRTNFYTTDATGGGQKIHVANSSNCWEEDNKAINSQPCAAGNGAQVFTFTGGSGIDNWVITSKANSQRVLIFADAAGKPLWTNPTLPPGSLAKWLI